MKFMQILWLATLLAASAVAATTTAAATTAAAALPGADLESLLALARADNPDLAVLRHETLAAEQRVLPAGALPDPRLRLELQDLTRSGEQNPSLWPGRVGSTAYWLLQDLPGPGKRALRLEIASAEVLAAQGRSRQSGTELAARIKTLFAQRYLIQGTQRLVSENLNLMLQLEKVLQVRYAGGLAAQQDITRIHVEHTGMRAELVALASDWQQSQTRLNALLARPLDAPLAAPLALRPLPQPSRLDLAQLSERLRNANPALAVEAARLLSAEKNRALADHNRYPDFSVGINAMQRQRSVKEWGLMVELNLPLQGDLLQAQQREAQALLAAAQARQAAATNQALTDLSGHLIALQAARQTEHLMQFSLLPQADLTWRAALAGYENGKADFATLLDAQRQIRQAQLGQLKAQVEAQLRLAEIERLLGEDL